MAARVLVMSFSDLSRDPRVHRQLTFLAEGGAYETFAVGEGHYAKLGARSMQLKRRLNVLSKAQFAGLLLIRAFSLAYWTHRKVRAAYRLLRDERFDLIVANDLDTLWLALRLARGAPVVFDAHEYYPDQFGARLRWRFFIRPFYQWLCKRLLPRAAAILTVSEGIAEEYRKNFSVEARVVTNAPFFKELRPQRSDQRRIRLVHHGGAQEGRGIEELIQMMDCLDERFTLDLMLVCVCPSYLEKLKTLSSHHPRIRFRDPVPMTQIAQATNAYDLGLFLYRPTSINSRYVLPNKLFEYIQARLAPAIGPSPEMQKIVERYGCGVVSRDFNYQSLASCLSALTYDDIDRLKTGADRAARELCAENNRDIFLGAVTQALECEDLCAG